MVAEPGEVQQQLCMELVEGTLAFNSVVSTGNGEKIRWDLCSVVDWPGGV